MSGSRSSFQNAKERKGKGTVRVYGNHLEMKRTCITDQRECAAYIVLTVEEK
ncbi:hypothetical protein Fmac_012694 [Flemingia macrophylla]|uniref:Uncharacterized protein n=1 Tax=Flemingia macrophylla TaxID=520843 RepID=A0ABD1MR10_9FABA